ncbi:MAG: 2,3-bisphosphoglycerate-independent phosphoglycerate mutase [Deltaproteobacteria bacterium]|nr:MAG: 2,3-bisphosphoglycerate-independent phosphoglycerate mutase [Deltaproteobacteria bacterium]
MTRPLALIILDGWGLRDDCTANAVCQARTPRLDALAAAWPSARLNASGLNVGLPDGQMGNSEVGHLNIGAGRIIYQDLTRISKSIADGDFFANPALRAAMAATRTAGGRLHLIGLLSDGGVHSHLTHLYALVEMARREGLGEVFIHALTDGRDTPPKSAAGYLAQLEQELTRIGLGRVATVIGRYYAMDRDNRWERVEQAWRAMVLGEGDPADSGAAAIAAAYAAGETDEFVKPKVIVSAGRVPGTIGDGDGIVFFNFRADRARELTRTFTQADFAGFARPRVPALSSFVCMSEYDETFALPVAFPPESYPDLLGTVVSRAGLKQLRIAETEKYAHVTFFFNGGEETPAPGEDRVLIPSPKDVATYDLKPAMSAVEVTDEVVRRIAGGDYALIVLNYANPDMVGHTGILPAAIEAMETVDSCVGRVVDALLAAGGAALITADHGNCEQMSDGSGSPHTAHTANLVPLILVDPQRREARLRDGILADIAPTILALLGLPQPAAMTGKTLIMS